MTSLKQYFSIIWVLSIDLFLMCFQVRVQKKVKTSCTTPSPLHIGQFFPLQQLCFFLDHAIFDFSLSCQNVTNNESARPRVIQILYVCNMAAYKVSRKLTWALAKHALVNPAQNGHLALILRNNRSPAECWIFPQETVSFPK